MDSDVPEYMEHYEGLDRTTQAHIATLMPRCGAGGQIMAFLGITTYPRGGSGRAKVSGKASVYGEAKVFGDASVSGSARVLCDDSGEAYAEISGNMAISGDAEVVIPEHAMEVSPIGRDGAFATFYRTWKGAIEVAFDGFVLIQAASSRTCQKTGRVKSMGAWLALRPSMQICVWNPGSLRNIED